MSEKDVRKPRGARPTENSATMMGSPSSRTQRM